MINKSANSGSSLTLSFTINNDIVFTGQWDMKIYLGGVLIGSLLDQTPPIIFSSPNYDIKLSGKSTLLYSGYREIEVILDDDGGIGVKKAIVGSITFKRLPDGFSSNSISSTRDIIIDIKHSDFY